MGFIAKEAPSDFKKVQAGNYVGRCYSMIDIGTQEGTGQSAGKNRHKIRIVWELFGEDDMTYKDKNGKMMPLTITREFTLSMFERADLRKTLEQWRGRGFTEEEAASFDVSKLVGAYGMVNVTHDEKNGKVYANVAGVTQLPAALKNMKPEPAHPNSIFDLDNPDMEIFANLPEFVQDKIKKSPEWASYIGKGNPYPAGTMPQGSGFDDMPDDIPF